MRAETLKGYLFIPGAGAPVAVYAKGLTALPTTAAVRGDDRRQPDRATRVRAAAEGAQAGLYMARVKVLRGQAGSWMVERGRPVASLTDEIRKLDARARTRREGKVLTEREVQRARQARCLADALRAHVLRCTACPAPARRRPPRPARAQEVLP